MHFGLDLLIADAWSVQIIFGDLERFYRDPELVLEPLGLTFRDYVLAEHQMPSTDLYRRSREYWLARLDALPASATLPLVKDASEIENPVFERCHGVLEAEVWSRLPAVARDKGLTPSGLLLSAFAEVLGRWSRSRHFIMNVTTFNRLPLHEQSEHLVGDFTSLNLLEVDGRPETAGPSFEGRARQIQNKLFEDLEYRYFSGLSVLRELARRRTGKPGALAPIVFTSLLDSYGRSGDFVPLGGEVVFAASQTPQVWLDHQVREEDGRLFLTWDVVAELLPQGLPQVLFDAYLGLLRALVDEATWTDPALDLLPAEQHRVVAEANDTSTEIPSALLHELFLEQARRHPERPAVITSDRTLSYGELLQGASTIGAILAERGARPDTLVAVVMHKGRQQIPAVLGILMAGAAYVPISADLPAERRNYLLENAEVSLVLTQDDYLDEDWPPGLEVFAVSDTDDGIGLRTTDGPAAREGVQDGDFTPWTGPADHLAYVIFTSGSTGNPKGVVIDHRGAVNTILDVNGRFGVGPADRVFALSSLSFDLSVYDVFGTLAAGGALVMPDAGAGRDPRHWHELAHTHGVTVWNSVPPLMDMWVTFVEGDAGAQGLPSSLRLVLMSGDWIPVALPDRIRALHDGDPVLISMGGATEASIWSILYEIGEVSPDQRSIPYGKAMLNQRFHVLDACLEPCPVWVPGELYIGGIGLAKAYWRDGEKTSAAFFEHPRTGERLYRTGDLGRLLPDGNIEFLGREDFQVKIQGYRIELGEIEAALLRHAAVDAVVVDAPKVGREATAPRRLVAYLVCDSAPADQLGELLSAHLGELLPDYMVPSVFVPLDAIPLTANGKVDRKALPEPDWSTTVKTVAPSSPLEQQLAALWAEVLGLSAVERDAGFFELGGNSLMAIQMLTRVQRETATEVPLRQFFGEPTVAGLASLVAQAKVASDQAQSDASSELPTLVHDEAGRYRPFPLSDIQQAYWMGRSGALELGNTAAHFYFELDLETAHPERIAQAWRRLIAHHDMLRVIFNADGTQQVLDQVPDFECRCWTCGAGIPSPPSRASGTSSPTRWWPRINGPYSRSASVAWGMPSRRPSACISVSIC